MQSECRVHSPEVRTLCPHPRRALPLVPSTPPQRSDPGSPYPSSPEWASTELCELLANKDTKFNAQAASPAFSQVSTSAGPTPVPERIEPTPNADFQHLRSTMTTVDEEAPNDREDDRSLKVFVGGIPQEMTGDDLTAFFSSWTRVTRAWIQKHKPSEQQSMVHMANHRGFGFVIFQDNSSVHEVLGNEFSRHIMMPNGRRLEVKRAVSSHRLEDSMSKSGGAYWGDWRKDGWRKENNHGAFRNQARPGLESKRLNAAPTQPRVGPLALAGGSGQNQQTLGFPMATSGVPFSFPTNAAMPPEIMGRSVQELERMLKQAMPETYDD